MRLGEEAYTSQLTRQHKHISQDAHHAPRPGDTHRHVSQREHHSPRPVRQAPLTATGQDTETLNWAGLVGWLVSLPKILLGLLLLGGLFLFGLFGPLLFVPLVLLVLFTGPFRGMLKPEQRQQLDDMVAWINRAIEEQRA